MLNIMLFLVGYCSCRLTVSGCAPYEIGQTCIEAELTPAKYCWLSQNTRDDPWWPNMLNKQACLPAARLCVLNVEVHITCLVGKADLPFFQPLLLLC